MNIYVKNMVCSRCKMAVKNALEALEIPYKAIELTVVEVKGKVAAEKLKILDNILRQQQLELIGDRKEILVERIRTTIIDLIHNYDKELKLKLSEYLSERLNHDYGYLANIFSQVQGISIEKFYIRHKIELVKEMIVYNQLNLKEISSITHYSSLAHLSYQFKKTTGLAPSQFRILQQKELISLDRVA